MRTEIKFKLAAICVFIVMLFVAAIPYQTSLSTGATFTALKDSVDKQIEFDRLLDVLRDAETGQRGFIITGKEVFLERYYLAIGEMPSLRRSLHPIEDASEDEKKAVAEIFRVVDLKLDLLSKTVEIRRINGFAEVEPIISAGTGKKYMDTLRELIGDQIAVLDKRRAASRAEMMRKSGKALYVGIFVTLVNLALFGILMVLMFRALKERQITATLLEGTSEELRKSMAEIERRRMQKEVSAEMLQALGSIGSLAETSRIIAIYCAKLMPELSGTLFLYRNSRDLLEAQASWGANPPLAEQIEPSECWALHRGRAHQTGSSRDLCCDHYRAASVDDIGRLCIPLVTQGEVIGLICIEGLSSQVDEAASQHRLADRVSEQIALALSNVKLRETLRYQSVVDPLTGLFNRRYMDETLKREIARAVRKNLPLSLIVLDLDHFKMVNDKYGHDGGDALLKAVARHLQDHARESDLACRFGGEEMVLILPECDRETAIERAQSLRRSISALDVHHAGQTLGAATASFGVACFPEHASEPEALFQAADKALYNAKHAGRNCVMAAGS